MSKIVLYDGVCGLCNQFVQWVMQHESKPDLLFAPLDGPTARSLGYNLAGATPESIVLVSGDQKFYKSDAALRIARFLSFPWNLLYVFRIVPRFLRDLVYDFVARHRYQWFGKFDSCPLPTPEQKSRFRD